MGDAARAVSKGDPVEVRDGVGNWHPRVADSGVEQGVDMLVVWVHRPGYESVPWPAWDVRPAEEET
jgi:hypothetical protein